MKLENLIVLTYASNTCYTQVVAADKFKEKDFSIDLKKKKWSYHTYQNIKIGDSRHVPSTGRHGVIGVYDRNNIKHLNSILFASISNTGDGGYDMD